ncbi:hypothetical protein [Ralstonia pseudosolanacearum]|uniref:hypothetical protein n=1 Tax=Ralstonia pseudosolanacearum TaxID=1310165 RepID=UPI001FFA834D|nr:hypothetical protein [Ralstonia pseudosolanacearum]
MIEFHGRQGWIGTVVWQNPAALPVSAGRRIHGCTPGDGRHGIAEHLPWDALAMKAMLERLPLIGGPRNAA